MAEIPTQSSGAAARSAGPTHEGRKLFMFVLGAAGALAVFLLFWARNPQVVLDAADSLLTICIGGVGLLIVVAIAGLVVWWSAPATPLQALEIAVTVPGLVFAVDLGAGAIRTDEPSAPEGQYDVTGAAEEDTGVLEPGLESPSFFDRVRLAIAPISAVERHEAIKAERAIMDARQREAAAAADVKHVTGAMTELAASLEEQDSAERRLAVERAHERLNDLTDSGVTILTHQLEDAPEGAQLFGLKTLERRPGRLPAHLQPKIKQLEEHGKSDRVRDTAKRAGEKILPPDGGRLPPRAP